MEKVWKDNTKAFVLQVVIAGFLGALFDGTGILVRFIMFVVAFIVAAGFSFKSLTMVGEFLSAALLSAVIASILAPGEFTEPIVYISLFALVAIVSLIADTARRSGAKENFFLLFLVAIPFGIGTILGSAIRGWESFSDMAGWE